MPEAGPLEGHAASVGVVGRVLRHLPSSAVIVGPSEWFRLMRPRCVKVAGDGTTTVTDAENYRMVASTLAGEYRWVLTDIPHHRLPSLNDPRWGRAVSAGELVVSDTRHHRILHLRRSGS